MPEGLVAAVDAIVGADGRLDSRSAALQQAIREFVERRARAAVDAAIVAGYRAVPPGAADEWGDLHAGALSAALTDAARLDAEDGGW